MPGLGAGDEEPHDHLRRPAPCRVRATVRAGAAIGPSRRRSRPGLRDPLWAKLSIIVGAVVMVVSGLSVVVPKIAAAWFFSDVPQVDAIPEELRGASIDGPINFLLLGMDDREGEGVDRCQGRLDRLGAHPGRA